ncbi:MAG: Formate hydrogenlyase subunit 6/NADH:ubiquinone oxidoreductase 23 kD subunit [Methanophagales archaeon]|nr:4Fe-4S binding protein [Methanophagales archaeon]MCU4139457.1 Formate hydrogenlyase subunit 6/NADH:ubiquinone oxidoreductase 23 kD subunit [Methanophagales archaeon]
MRDVKKIAIPEYDAVEKAKRHTFALITAAREAIMPLTFTIHYPTERKLMPKNFRGFILFEPEKCINCWQCAFICPANAIRMKKASDNRYYPTIDYAKCIFCHFCVDSCPRGALKPTKIHDVAYKDMEEMLTLTDKMIEKPEVHREDERFVDYVLGEDDATLKRERGKDDFFVEVPTPPEVRFVSRCVQPESCLGCRICEGVCESGAISSVVEDGVRKMRIDEEKCTGCGLCVKECAMQILTLVRVR